MVDDDPVVVSFWSSYYVSCFLRFVGYLSDDSCFPVTLLSLILHLTIWCLAESAMKLIIRRARPPQYYFKQKDPDATIPSFENMHKLPRPPTGVMLPGDQYSFPSGHTIRAFGLARMLVKDPLMVQTFDNFFQKYEVILLCVAASVGWARMALGRHTLGDIIGGALLGLFSVDILQPWLAEAELEWSVLLISQMYMVGLFCLVIFDLFFGENNNKSGTKDISWVRKTLGFVDLKHQKMFLFIFSSGFWLSMLFASVHSDEFDSCSRP